MDRAVPKDVKVDGAFFCASSHTLSQAMRGAPKKPGLYPVMSRNWMVHPLGFASSEMAALTLAHSETRD